MYLGSTYTVAGKCDPFRWICHRLVSGVYFAVQVKLTDEVARLTSVAVKYCRREPIKTPSVGELSVTPTGRRAG